MRLHDRAASPHHAPLGRGYPAAPQLRAMSDEAYVDALNAALHAGYAPPPPPKTEKMTSGREVEKRVAIGSAPARARIDARTRIGEVARGMPPLDCDYSHR
jgi:hypothetical protein